MTTAAHYQAMIRDGVLYLSATEVSDESVAELRRSLPNLAAYR
ncbi:MAG: hypothetical protein ACK5PF_00050 [bacterium]